MSLSAYTIFQALPKNCEKEIVMLVTVDKRGSISLPSSTRKDLGIKPGTHLEISVEPGGVISLYPVEIYRTIKLNEAGLLKLKEARDSETARIPTWFEEERGDAGTDSK
jgi:AbrB family looped-hinge helix DNA binding protein